MNRSILVTIAVSAVIFTTIGVVAGLTAPWRGQTGIRVSETLPAADPCDRSPGALARRNIFWKMWSGHPVEPPTPDSNLAAAVGVIIKPGLPAELRNQAIQSYLSKSALYFSPEEMTQAQEDLANGTPERRLMMFKHIAAIDLDASRLVSCVLADDARVSAFLAGQPIPQETSP